MNLNRRMVVLSFFLVSTLACDAREGIDAPDAGHNRRDAVDLNDLPDSSGGIGETSYFATCTDAAADVQLRLQCDPAGLVGSPVRCESWLVLPLALQEEFGGGFTLWEVMTAEVSLQRGISRTEAFQVHDLEAGVYVIRATSYTRDEQQLCPWIGTSVLVRSEPDVLARLECERERTYDWPVLVFSSGGTTVPYPHPAPRDSALAALTWGRHERERTGALPVQRALSTVLVANPPTEVTGQSPVDCSVTISTPLASAIQFHRALEPGTMWSVATVGIDGAILGIDEIAPLQGD